MAKLMNYKTGETLREATAEEAVASVEAANHDGGAGVISVDGVSCFVEALDEYHGTETKTEPTSAGLMKFAAIGTDGLRPVVWGLGATEDDAKEDARREAFASNVDADVTGVAPITADQAARIRAGEIDPATLGIKVPS